jgi:hypothetical protein
VNPKRQKKYQDRETIIRDIDRSRRRMIKLRRLADEEDAAADFMLRHGNIEGRRYRESAAMRRARASRIESTRLPKLGRVLAAFDTGVLGIEGMEKPQAVLEKL